MAGALDEAERAIDDVFAAPGRTNGRTELDRLKAEIGRFRRDNELDTAPVDGRGVLPFEEMFAGQGAWPGPDQETDVSLDVPPSHAAPPADDG